MEEKRISLRLSEEHIMALEEMKKFLKDNHLEMNDSQLIRYSIMMTYEELKGRVNK